MALRAVIGPRNTINTSVLNEAAMYPPALVLDCSNCADPYKLVHHVNPDDLEHVHVVEIEMLYKLRHMVEKIPFMLDTLRIGEVYITTFDRLFHYQDEWENYNIYAHTWEILKEIALDYDIVVAVREGTLQEKLARRHAEVHEWAIPSQANAVVSIA